MRLSSLIFTAATFGLAAGLSVLAANFSVSAIEGGSEIAVRRALDNADHGWAEVEANGLQVILSGVAATEAVRFQAVSVTGGTVDAARIIDHMTVAATADIAPPRFSAEILRNDSGISIIGLIPASSDRDTLIERITDVADGAPVTDLLETADYPVPNGWDDAMGFAVIALSRLPRSKVSVDAGRIAITAISDSIEAKRKLDAELHRAAPPGLRMALDIAAPRPVLTPFTLRYVIDESGGRFDACSADTDAAKLRILRAAADANLTGPPTCTVGMGVPSTSWAQAAEQAITSLAAIGYGTVTFSDADITLIATEGSDQAVFDRVIGELEVELPDVFALHAVLLEPEASPETGPVEFTATLSPEGLVQLRGRLNDENLRRAVDSFAKASFGTSNVYTAARIVDGLPARWPVRVLAALDALARLKQGVVVVTPDMLDIRGVTEREEASTEIAALLSQKLGEGALYALDITYHAPPEPEDAPPDPDQCEIDLAEIQAAAKIQFEPGSATIAAESLETMNLISDILDKCADIRLEIQGHTDSQGREQMNQELSQARAQSVLNELRARRVLTASYVAKGYGEAVPIADNGTEDGREANRRIEFRLIRPAPTVEDPSTLEEIEATTAAQSKTQTETDAPEDAEQQEKTPDEQN